MNNEEKTPTEKPFDSTAATQKLIDLTRLPVDQQDAARSAVGANMRRALTELHRKDREEDK